MMNDKNHENVSGILYQPDESPPTIVTYGMGLQHAVLCAAGIVLTPAVVIRAANGSEDYLSWAIFTAVIVSGVSTVLQALGKGRAGAGYILAMGTSGAFIAVCVTALLEGGPAMLATLIIISSLFQFLLSTRLSLFRRILTPTVSGTVIMLIPVTVMPIIFGMLDQVPGETAAGAAPICALVTMVVIIVIALKAVGLLRLWALIIGVVSGSILSIWYGLYDIKLVAEASFIGLPGWNWPGFDLGFGPVFWKLLPAFIFVTLVGAIETIGDSVAIQQVSWRTSRAIDFKAVQGAVAADGVGNLLSGLLGTVPNTTYSTSISVTEITGIAARSVGVALGVIFIVLAFSPKFLALILAIPGPVAAAYIAVLLSMLFVLGMKLVVQEGLDYRQGLIAGVSFWIGVGFQNNLIFPEFTMSFAGGMFQNGMTAGGLTAIVMTSFMALTESRRRRIELMFDISVLPDIRKFLRKFASRNGWDGAMSDRLEAASEETLLTLLNPNEDVNHKRKLLLTAYKEGGTAVLEFIAGSSGDNLQNRMALLGEQLREIPREKEISLRLLKHLASSVHHQQYHNTDIVTIRVKSRGLN